MASLVRFFPLSSILTRRPARFPEKWKLATRNLLDGMARFMADIRHGTELRADGSDLGPPVSLSGAQSALPARLKTAGTVIGIKVSKTARVVSGADERVFSAPKMAERAPVPPDPLFLAYLERCHPILHRIITRHDREQAGPSLSILARTGIRDLPPSF